MSSHVTIVKGARHRALSSTIAAEIRAGRHKVGSALPTETDLQARFGASRYAVREALRELKEAGLVTSHAGVGTIVRSREAAPRGIQVLGSMDDVLQIVRDTRFEMVSEREVRIDATQAARLSIAANEVWHVFVLMRHADTGSDPLAHVAVHVRPEFAAVGVDIGKARVPVFRLVEQRFGERVVEVEQEVAAARLRAPEARLLHARTGSAALHVVRRFSTASGRVILVSEGYYPEGRFVMNNRLALDRPRG